MYDTTDKARYDNYSWYLARCPIGKLKYTLRSLESVLDSDRFDALAIYRTREHYLLMVAWCNAEISRRVLASNEEARILIVLRDFGELSTAEIAACLYAGTRRRACRRE
jgi:hypothetical protein